MNVLGMQASSCRVVEEVRNEKLAEAAGREVQGSGVRAAPVRARSRRCRGHSLDRYGLAHDRGELLAGLSLECLGSHPDQGDLLAFPRQNNWLRGVAGACMDVVPSSFVGYGPRTAIRRGRHQRRWTGPYRERRDTR